LSIDFYYYLADYYFTYLFTLET